MTALLAGCGGAQSLGHAVGLLPVRARTNSAWHWNGRCPLSPAAAAGCSGAGPILGSAQLNGDEWNLGGPAKDGSVNMSVGTDGAVTLEGRFARAAPCTASSCLAPSAYTWVRGYPNVLYGINQCYADTSPRPSPRLPLPLRLDSIPAHLVGVTAYSAHTSDVTFDVTYDLWLHPTGTTRPCRTQGTLEILVWTDYDARALLPPSLEVGTASIPYAVDGVVRAHSKAWSIYASNIYTAGRTAPWGGTLWFVPAKAEVVRHGRVSVELSAVLSAAERLLHDDYGWPTLSQRYWLDTAAFGVEFGPASGQPTDSRGLHFSARISAYCLDVQTALAAACGSATGKPTQSSGG